MTDKLTVYNDAILVLGHERLASLAEQSTARFAFDDAYPAALRYCLEQGFWNFAMRTVMMQASPSLVPAFGYSSGYARPEDFVRLHSMSAEDTMQTPLLDFVDEAGVWWTNCDPLFARFVSSDASYGGDLSRWPETFALFVSHHLATRTCKRITGSVPSEEQKRDTKQAAADARSKDAMNEPPGFPPTGSWVRSRSGGRCAGRAWRR